MPDIPSFSDFVASRRSGFQTQIDSFIADLKAQGVTANLRSGARTYAQQKALWNKRGSNKNPVAPPGTSLHEFDLARDFNFSGPLSLEQIGRIAEKHGLTWGGRFQRPDPGHVQIGKGDQQPAAPTTPAEIPSFSDFMKERNAPPPPPQSPADRRAAYGERAAYVQRLGATRGLDLGKLERDVDWHFGSQTLAELKHAVTTGEGLTKDQIQNIVKLTQEAAAEDDRKRAAGQKVFERNTGYQNEMRKKVNLQPASSTATQAYMQSPAVRTAQTLDNFHLPWLLKALVPAAALLPESWEQSTYRAATEGVAGAGESLAGLLNFFSGETAYTPAIPSPASRLATNLQNTSSQLREAVDRVEQNKPLTGAVPALIKTLVPPAIEFAPLLAAPEGGAPAVMALIGGFGAMGRKSAPREVAKETVTNGLMGLVFEAFPLVPPEWKAKMKAGQKIPTREVAARVFANAAYNEAGFTLINAASGQPFSAAATNSLWLLAFRFPELVPMIKVKLPTGRTRSATLRDFATIAEHNQMKVPPERQLGTTAPLFDITTATPEPSAPGTARPGQQKGRVTVEEPGQGELFTATRRGAPAGREDLPGFYPEPQTIEQFAQSLGLDPNDPKTIARYQEYRNKVQETAGQPARPGPKYATWEKEASDAEAEWERRSQKRKPSKNVDKNVKDAINYAREHGPTPAFRAFFGGIEPRLAGATIAEVQAFAKKLGIKWEPQEGWAAAEQQAVKEAKAAPKAEEPAAATPTTAEPRTSVGALPPAPEGTAETPPPKTEAAPEGAKAAPRQQVPSGGPGEPQQAMFTFAGPGGERVPVFNSAFEDPNTALVRLQRIREDPEQWDKITDPDERKLIDNSIRDLKSGKTPLQILEEAGFTSQPEGVMRASAETAKRNLDFLKEQLNPKAAVDLQERIKNLNKEKFELSKKKTPSLGEKDRMGAIDRELRDLKEQLKDARKDVPTGAAKEAIQKQIDALEEGQAGRIQDVDVAKPAEERPSTSGLSTREQLESPEKLARAREIKASMTPEEWKRNIQVRDVLAGRGKPKVRVAPEVPTAEQATTVNDPVYGTTTVPNWEKLSQELKGQGGFINMGDAFDMVGDFFRGLPLEISKDLYAATVKAVQGHEAAKEMMLDSRLNSIDATVEALRNGLNRMKPQIRDDLMLARGKPETIKGRQLQAEAIKRLQAIKDPKLRQLVGKTMSAIQEGYDWVHKYSKLRGLDIPYREDYFRGVWADPENRVDDFLKFWRTTTSYTKQKAVPTVADGLAWGLKLKDSNPVDNMLRELTEIERNVQMKGLADHLKTLPGTAVDGTKLTWDQQMQLRQNGWVTLPDKAFEGMWMEPKYASYLHNLLKTNEINMSRLTKGLRDLSRLGQKLKFMGSLFHAKNMIKASVAAETGGIFNPQGWKDAVWSAVRGAKDRSKLGISEADHLSYINLAGGHGYTMEAQGARSFGREWNVLVEQNLGQGAGKAVRLASSLPGLPGFQRFLFNDYIPTLKEIKYFRDLHYMEDKLGRPLSDYEKIDIIKRNQNFYGEMNERLFGRSRGMTSALRIPFTAPGFGEGNLRTMARAIKEPLEAVGKVRRGEQLTKMDIRSAQFMIQSFMFSAAVAQITTRLLTGKWATPKTVREAFMMHTGDTDKDGAPIFFDMLSYDKDYWTALGLVANALPLSKATKEKIGVQPTMLKSLNEVRQRVAGAESPVFGALVTAGNWITTGQIYDWRGRPQLVEGQTKENFWKIVDQAVDHFEPIIVSTVRQAMSAGLPSGAAVGYSVFGFRPVRNPGIYNLAHDWNVDHGHPPRGVFTPSEYQDLTDTLGTPRETAALNALKGVKEPGEILKYYKERSTRPLTGNKDYEEEFRKSLTPAQMDMYMAEYAKRERDLARIQQLLHLHVPMSKMKSTTTTLKKPSPYATKWEDLSPGP